MSATDLRAELARDVSSWEGTCVRKPRPRFIGRQDVDVAIIGGGLTGLSTALHLMRAQPDWSVILLEAEQIGAGASGRSTGIVGPGVGTGISPLRSRFGPRAARRMFRHSQDAVDTVAKLTSDERIECDATPSAQLLCATTRAQAARLERHSRVFRELHLDVPLVDRDQLAGRLGHQRYRCALEYQPVLLVNPLKLTLGLADAAASAGVRVTERSRVTGLSADRGGVRLQVDKSGSVRARMAVVATDGYTPPGFPHRRRVFSVRTHVMATRPLTDTERAGLAWSGREGVIDQRLFFSYYRLDVAGRLLFGGGRVCVPGAGHGASEQVWRRLESEMAALFPTLAGVPVEHRWSGLTAATIDDLPVVGEVPGQPGVFFAGAWRGHGLALCIEEGAWLANRLAHGEAEDIFPWHRSRPFSPRLGPLQETGVRGYVAAMDALDRGGAAVGRLRTGGR